VRGFPSRPWADHALLQAGCMAATGSPLTSVHKPGTRERSMYGGALASICAPESKQQVESVVWKASGNASAHQREAEEGALR
jgi:hypothetical protein